MEKVRANSTPTQCKPTDDSKKLFWDWHIVCIWVLSREYTGNKGRGTAISRTPARFQKHPLPVAGRLHGAEPSTSEVQA